MARRKKEKKAADIPNVLSNPSVVEQIEWLEHSILHAMSLGNHELFHSNVWAWLINRNPEFATIFFPELKGKSVCAKREDKHRDITIGLAGDSTDLYVVENKFKSLPDINQLDKYSRGIGKLNRFRRGAVVGIESPDWRQSDLIGSDEGQWVFIPFATVVKDIASRVGILPNMQDGQYVSDYCEATKRGLALLNSLLDAYENELPNPGQDWTPLHKVRLRDVFFKISAQRFTYWLAKDTEFCQMQKRFSGRGWDLSLSNSFSNSSWIVNAEIQERKDAPSTKGEKNSPWFGLQLQGRQFRRCAAGFDIPSSGADAKKERTPIGRLFDKFCFLHWLEITMRSDWRKNEPNVSQRKKTEFGQFKPSFVYQYIDLTDYSWPSLRQLILKHLNEALQIENPF